MLLLPLPACALRVGLIQALGLMNQQRSFRDMWKQALEPAASRMDQSKWDVTRAITLSGAGLSTAIVFLITQIGVKSSALSVSLFCASVAIPTWLALWRVGEAYSFFGPKSYGHFSTLRGSGSGILLFLIGLVLLLMSFVTLIWHFSVASSIAFLIGTILMVAFVFWHQASVQAWARQGPRDEA